MPRTRLRPCRKVNEIHGVYSPTRSRTGAPPASSRALRLFPAFHFTSSDASSVWPSSVGPGSAQRTRPS